MKKLWIGAVGVLFLGLIVAGAFWTHDSGLKYGYLKGFDEGVASVPSSSKVLLGTASWAGNITGSKVVSDSSMKITLVLRGKLLSASSADKSIVIGAGNDSLTVFFTQDAVMPAPGATIQPKLDMTRVGEFVGKDVTVVAVLAQDGSPKIEGTTFFSSNASVRLN